ncbi:hypothetical protein FD733_01390 [Pantoea sp. Eser]|nr:hypothetical protein [Pantoea sp. Eser]
MPSITLYTSATHRLDADSFAEFSKTLVNLARDILKAKENNIHISYVIAETEFGTPVYFEASLRQEVFRTVPVLDDFMHQVDLLIKEKTGVIARIRCLSFEADNTYATN